MKLFKKNLQIAIDGPVAAGKSSVAFLLAKALGILYVYTGAMYRAVAYLGLRNKLSLKKERPLLKILKKVRIKLTKPSKKSRFCDVFVNGENVTERLFTPRIDWGSSQVGVFPKVRKYLVFLQKEIAKDQAVVMEGRDVTTIVLPKADLKIFMTADRRVRAKRKLLQLKKKGIKVSFKKVLEEVKKRDWQDSHRKADPLKIASNAWVLDTSNLSISQVVEKIIERLKEKKLVL